MSGFDTQTIARVWPFLPKEKRNELLTPHLQGPPSTTPLLRLQGPDARSKTSATVVELSPYKPGKGVVASFPAIATGIRTFNSAR